MTRYVGNMVMALCISATSPVLAEEVLYCTDTQVVGFSWDISVIRQVPTRPLDHQSGVGQRAHYYTDD